MRVFNKYKYYSKIYLNSYPLRILKFKRTKWKKVQKRLKFLSVKKCLIKHNSVVAIKGFWYKVKYFFKNKLKLKNQYKCKYDGFTHFKQKQKSDYNKLIPIFFFNEFLLEILLWQLGFFLSVYQAKEAVFFKLVLVNNAVYKRKQCLKKGDIITLKKNIKIKNNQVSKKVYYSFLELDFYTNTIILTKNILSVNNLDLSFIIQEKYDFYSFKNILKS